MTPKQQYEARKVERQKLKDLDYQVRQREEQIATLDMLDRFVTAVERIADAMDRTTTSAGMAFDPDSASGFRVANSFGGNT